MADTSDQDSKTEEPTEKKIRDALEQGKIPVSRETSIFASMAALLVILAFLIEDGVQRLAVTLKSLLDDPDGFRLTSAADANGLLLVIGLEAMRFMLPIVLVLAVFGLASSLLQNSPRLVLERVRPNFSRLSPAQGWSRIYGSQGRVEFAKALFKMVSVSLIVGVVLESSQAKAFEVIFT
ncbi:MAG TPA: EscU/YscU/HrcU family type III secretion system export apparatus switch protein, partial [Bradyrhizobium sp.]|uniref:EscU/YscU/HrcU family type III secretion system export apparatus switch protein n=1 Tax=Bradyrhizobium sp. TaxID=376 RepID=UPI002B468A1C